MTVITGGWGAGPSARFDLLAAQFRPVLEDIRKGAVRRELDHVLPFGEIEQLRTLGFPRLRLPVEHGGSGASLPELFALLIELGSADANLPNVFRSHLGFCEEVIDSTPGAWRDTWLARLGSGDITGSGFSEADNIVGSFSTRLVRKGDGWFLNGVKYYTSGSLYADWINLGATYETGENVGIMVPTKVPGVEIDDDWDGFGQQLSASGTARFTDVEISDDLIKPSVKRFRYAPGFFQLVHMATLTGIGRTAAGELSELVAKRTRVYGGRSVAARSSEDPQILQVVGRVRSLTYVAGAAVLKAAEALQRAADLSDSTDDEARVHAYTLADIEVSQCVTVVTDLIFEATTILFDALGASAAKKGLNLDRHWRNARTLASHNPRVYHDRIVGDFAVNGTPPPLKGGVGNAVTVSAATEKVA